MECVSKVAFLRLVTQGPRWIESLSGLMLLLQSLSLRKGNTATHALVLTEVIHVTSAHISLV